VCASLWNLYESAVRNSTGKSVEIGYYLSVIFSISFQSVG